jgi:YVTN family beta-propeller protein
MRPATLAPLAACAAALTVITSCLVASPAAAAGRSALPLLGYIPATATHKLDRFDPASGRLLRPITLPRRPLDMAIAPDGRIAYVASGPDIRRPIGTVSAIDLATRRVRAVINIGGYPLAVAVAPDGSFAYVALLRSVVVIDTSSLKVVKRDPHPRAGGGHRGAARRGTAQAHPLRPEPERGHSDGD